MNRPAHLQCSHHGRQHGVYRRAALAGATPHLGRSALDAAELMSVGCNYLREHMIDGARVHTLMWTGRHLSQRGAGPPLLRYEVRSHQVPRSKAVRNGSSTWGAEPPA
jgi:hypothetical protein